MSIEMPTEKLTIRASSVGQIMTNPVGKSNYEKWTEATQSLEADTLRYEAIANKATKTAEKLAEKLVSLKRVIDELEPVKDQRDISESAKTYLVNLFVSMMYDRKKDIVTPAIAKGLAVEEASISLYNLVKGTKAEKNTKRFYNEFLEGEPDLLFEELPLNEQVLENTVVDIKSSSDIFTYHKVKILGKYDNDYWWQLQSYMDLTGCDHAVLAYCLTDTPEIMIEDAKRRLAWQMGLIDPFQNETWLEAAADMDKQMTYRDIPLTQRVHEIYIPRDQEAIDRIHTRVKECRQWMDRVFDNIKKTLKYA